jgi:DNA-binding NtrC family response regulator
MPNILIADDADGITEVVKTLMEVKGYDAVTAADGRAAVEKAEETKPDVVVLDICMPEMSGLEVLSKIKRSLPRTEVIMISALSDPNTMEVAHGLGAFEYITKPFHMDYLLSTVSRALRMRSAAPAPKPPEKREPPSTPLVNLLATAAVGLSVLGGFAAGVVLVL